MLWSQCALGEGKVRQDSLRSAKTLIRAIIQSIAIYNGQGSYK